MKMLEDVIAIAKEAGEIIRDGYRKNFTVEFKTNSSNLVTEIDKKSEQTIISFIKEKYPTHGIIAEESGAININKNAEYVWVIDPLDGTTNFAHGLPIFSVSVGLQKNGETICGIVYDVMRDMAYTAEKGAGSYCNSRKLKVSENSNLSYSLLVTGFPYDVQENPGKVMNYFAAFLHDARAIRRLGSAAIDFCYVADGIFDGFWEMSLYPWDICAGRLVLEEAGGIVTDFEGIKRDIFHKQILATNGKVHDKMVQILKEAGSR
ncbi:MAG: inositol monophosphatase family protein [Acidobacteriota bacterium]